ncbi:DUF221-domain-containing protein [Tothia fuscella]|uniref:DUF221-domain-containing protein n=1 Tax=Tothia fuscella TaxID=1048955 RepID=A0A9P4TZT1_9PEZI|nr:DUF221-domain-containing protein [Tothia fuscella]
MGGSRVLHLLSSRAEANAPAATPISATEQFLRLVADPFRSQQQQSAFLASLYTSIGVTLIIALAFCFVRPFNAIVYAPRLKHADEKHSPPPLGKSPWAWIGPVFRTKETMLVEKVGLDAAIFIRFTKMCRNIFLVLTVVGCGILIPINWLGGNEQKFNKGAATLMKMTPQFMLGRWFWGLVIGAWIIDITVCFFLWINYRAVTRLRREYFESAEYQNSLHARTLMLTEIPKTMRTDEGIMRIVDEVKNTTDLPRAAIARNVKELPDLIEEHEDHVKELESVLAKYLKNPDKLPSKRPTTKPSKKDLSYVKGKKVDAIEYLTNRIRHLEGRIREVRGSVDQRNAMSYGFASYESVEEAHGVAYAGRKKHPQGSTVRLAPRPNDIIWNNLGLGKKAKRGKRITNNFYVALLTVFWTACNALLAVFVANLSNLGQVWHGFDIQLHANPKTWAVVQGVASPAITSAFYYFLPIIFRRLSIRAGDLTKTSRERHVVHKLYAFFVFNNLIIFSLFGALWGYVAAVIQAKNQNQDVLHAIRNGNIWNKVMIALCSVSPFWITWLLQRNLGAAIDLAQVVNLAWGSFARRFLSPTPRQLIEWTAPPPFDYASYYNYFLFYSTVALCFATLQPLVLPVTAFYFVLDSYLKTYLILYVFVTKTESGGQFWRVLFNRMLFAAFLSNVIIGALVKANALPGNLIPMLGALIPLPFVLAGFKWYCMRTYDDQIHYYTKGFINKEAGVTSDTASRRSNNPGIRFGHPALYKPLMTPMVHAKAQHMLSQVYQGRLDDDDTTSLAGFSDTYNMSSMKKGAAGKKAKPSGPFEFVNENEMNFEHFKNREEFKTQFGGDGEMYGRPEDIIRSGTPSTYRHYSGESDGRNLSGNSHTRSSSRDSDRTLDGGAPAGTVYPAGYHVTPSSHLRGISPSPDRNGSWTANNQSRTELNLVQNAAPMGASGGYRGPPSNQSTPDYEQPTNYDYFRGRR